MRARLNRAVFCCVALLGGAISGEIGLLNIGHWDAVATVCGRDQAIHVVYALPSATHDDVSSDNINNVDCFEH